MEVEAERSHGFLPVGALVFTIILLLSNVIHWLLIYLTLLDRGLP